MSEPARQVLEAIQSASGMAPLKFKKGFLRKLACRQFRLYYPASSAEVEQAFVERYEELILEHARAVPTVYEDPTAYALIRQIAEAVEHGAHQLGRTLAVRPWLGTVDTGAVNAMTVEIPVSNEYLFIFDAQLPAFAMLLAKAAAQALPFVGMRGDRGQFSTRQQDIAQKIAEDGSVVERFRQFVLAHVLTDRPGRAPQYFLGHPHAQLAEVLRDSIEYFVFGHEYGHIVQGHFDAEAAERVAINRSEAHKVEFSWHQELEADAVGTYITLVTMRHTRRMGISMGFAGVDLYHMGMDLYLRGRALVDHGKELQTFSQTHPPPSLRAQMCRDALKSFMSRDEFRTFIDDENQSADAAIQFSDAIRFALELMWQSVQPELKALHQSGKPREELWQIVRRSFPSDEFGQRPTRHR